MKGGAIAFLAAAAAAGAAAWAYGPGLYERWQKVSSSESAAFPESGRVTVERRSLVMDYTASGSLQAIRHHRVKMDLKKVTQAVILQLVEEGAEVKEGEELIRLDPQPIQEKIEQKEKELKEAENLVPLKKSWLEFEQSYAQSAISGAKEALQNTIDALKKFRQWDAPNQFDQLDKGISDAKENLEKSVKEFRDAETAADEVSFGDDEKRLQLEKMAVSAEQKVTAAQGALDRAELQKRIYQTYNYPDDLKAMQKKREQAELDLQKVKLRADADVQKAQKELEEAEKNVIKVKAELEEWRQDLAGSVIRAPAAGIVLYGDAESSRGGRQGDMRVGGTVFRGTLMTIPQAGGFKINIEVGEYARARLRENSPAIITFEAIPDLEIQGKLASISRYATRERDWDNNSPRVFRGEVELETGDPRLISGLTGRVRIIVETLENCLTLPVEAIFNEDGASVCYVQTLTGVERRVVEVGRSNDDHAQILSGVSEGEQVLTNPPPRSGGGESAAPASPAGPPAPAEETGGKTG